MQQQRHDLVAAIKSISKRQCSDIAQRQAEKPLALEGRHVITMSIHARCVGRANWALHESSVPTKPIIAYVILNLWGMKLSATREAFHMPDLPLPERSMPPQTRVRPGLQSRLIAGEQTLVAQK